MSEKVAVLGASKNPERFSYKAFHMLQEYGHEPVPVSPFLDELEGKKVAHKLSELEEPIDTLTMYVGANVSNQMVDEIIKLNPKRVIFNPGSENAELENALEKAGIHFLHACTLVLLRTNQFDKK